MLCDGPTDIWIGKIQSSERDTKVPVLFEELILEYVLNWKDEKKNAIELLYYKFEDVRKS